MLNFGYFGRMGYFVDVCYGSALLVTIPGFYLSSRKAAPLFSDHFSNYLDLLLI